MVIVVVGDETKFDQPFATFRRPVREITLENGK